MLALWVGAIVPDIIDGVASAAMRGHLGQWAGRSLVGLFAFCVPVGVPLTFLLRAMIEAPTSRNGETRFMRLVGWLRAVDVPRSDRHCVVFEGASVWVGALSHIVSDLLSHESSKLLWPWSADPAWFGQWWHAAWLRISLPGYPAYSIGPHFVGWIILSAVGAVMFVKYPPRIVNSLDK